MEDHYATLQVRPGASAQEIERAYRRLARANHPDLLRDVSIEVRQQAEEVLKRVNRAHHVLGDRDRRRAYDRDRTVRAAWSSVSPPARTAAPAAGRPAPRPGQPPAAERTSHWGAGGPIDIDWSAPPPPAPRPDTDIFSFRHLAWGVVLIVAFTLLLLLLWNPAVGQALPTPVPPPAP